MRNGLDLGGRTDGLVGSQTTLGIDQVRGEDGVNQSRLSQTSLTCYSTKIHGQFSIRRFATCFHFPKRGGGITAHISRTNTHHVELETALQQLPLNLRGNTVETDMAAREDSSRRRARRSSRGHYGRTGGKEWGRWEGSFERRTLDGQELRV